MDLSVGQQVLIFSVFAVVSAFISKGLREASRLRDCCLILASLAAVHFYLDTASSKMFALYGLTAVLNYLLLTLTPSQGFRSESAKHLPLLLLIVFKIKVSVITLPMLGVSYLCLRIWKFNIEFKNGAIGKPSLIKYLSFLFYFPTWVVGPINSFTSVQHIEATPPAVVGSSLLRILIGAGKYYVLGTIASRLNFENLWRDGHLHGALDFTISCIAYFLFLYCNFSGFIDMMHGVARLSGIQLPENFDRPFGSRNIKEFWNRWHITLSVLVRDTIFTPLSKLLVRSLGLRSLNFSICASIFVTFIIVGAWHGNGLHYVLFGAWHGGGLAVNHAYTVVLKKKLGRRFRSYESLVIVRHIAVATTFLYVSFSFFLFENSWSQIVETLHVLRKYYAL